MKKLLTAMLVSLALAACAAQGIKPSAPVYQTSFPAVPIAERVGGEWTGGPASPPK